MGGVKIPPKVHFVTDHCLMCEQQLMHHALSLWTMHVPADVQFATSNSLVVFKLSHGEEIFGGRSPLTCMCRFFVKNHCAGRGNWYFTHAIQSNESIPFLYQGDWICIACGRGSRALGNVQRTKTWYTCFPLLRLSTTWWSLKVNVFFLAFLFVFLGGCFAHWRLHVVCELPWREIGLPGPYHK